MFGVLEFEPRDLGSIRAGVFRELLYLVTNVGRIGAEEFQLDGFDLRVAGLHKRTGIAL